MSHEPSITPRRPVTIFNWTATGMSAAERRPYGPEQYIKYSDHQRLIAAASETTPASETAPPTDVDELIAELKSALEELRIAGATPKCQRCDYPNCYCKDVPASTTGHKR
jgi:hypothetical protein